MAKKVQGALKLPMTKIYTSPAQKKTEDYVTGRFG
jgi:ABC-type phosphate transport system ATPase subunit